MITLLESGEDTCVYCDKSKDGAHTHSGEYGEAFLCWPDIKKLLRLKSNKPREEQPQPLFDRINGQ